MVIGVELILRGRKGGRWNGGLISLFAVAFAFLFASKLRTRAGGSGGVAPRGLPSEAREGAGEELSFSLTSSFASTPRHALSGVAEGVAEPTLCSAPWNIPALCRTFCWSTPGLSNTFCWSSSNTLCWSSCPTLCVCLIPANSFILLRSRVYSYIGQVDFPLYLFAFLSRS